MKNANRAISIVLATALIFALAGCGLTDRSDSDIDKEVIDAEDSGARVEEIALDQTVASTESGIELSFPATWKSLDLNDEASVEMGDEDEKRYLIVVEDDAVNLSGDMTVEGYGDVVIANMKQDLTNAKASAWTRVNAGTGIEAAQSEVSGVFGGGEIGYLVTIFRNEDTFYQISAWSAQSAYENGKPLFDRILASVKLPE
ncbi:MAG: hypothetical protein LBH63_05630 [Clostridiales Family XIII bacterium]|jgi:hypothetical protein|nr:hypothetical protein [Clostridiales Family XIII bacterium]